MKIVIGLTGKIGAGKSAVAKYISKNYNASEHRFSQILMDILDRLYLPHKREYLQSLGACLRKIREDVIVEAFKKDLEKDKSEIIVIDGIRYPNEVKMLRSFEKNVLICIEAPVELRYERCKKRKEKEETRLTFEEFLKNEEAETEKRIEEICKEADFIINNDSTLEELFKKVDEIMELIAQK
ncbi:MAG: hypothetical protein DRN88_05550 [Candidatus Hydrothermarchaeota archaeon]|nr:MAG: hypothetical protein DRN88_05550 [Candidatus Hydrothermarchaeota archaeon]